MGDPAALIDIWAVFPFGLWWEMLAWASLWRSCGHCFPLSDDLGVGAGSFGSCRLSRTVSAFQPALLAMFSTISSPLFASVWPSVWPASGYNSDLHFSEKATGFKYLFMGFWCFFWNCLSFSLYYCCRTVSVNHFIALQSKYVCGLLFVCMKKYTVLWWLKFICMILGMVSVSAVPHPLCPNSYCFIPCHSEKQDHSNTGTV